MSTGGNNLVKKRGDASGDGKRQAGAERLADDG